MIASEPNLPDPKSPRFNEMLVWKLTQILREMAQGINRTQGSQWDGFHPILGSYHLWIDATGDLRIKSSAPTSDTDGTVIGTQT